MTSNDGGPVHPVIVGANRISSGMTLRDWFAGQALAGIMATDAIIGAMNQGESHLFDSYVAKACYQTADAMLQERSES